MKVELFFDPLPVGLSPRAYNSRQWGAQVSSFVEMPPDWRSAQVVLIGVPESRGNGQGRAQSPAPRRIREQFYALARSAHPVEVVDLGDLRAGETSEDTIERLREVCSAVLEAGAIPVVLGGSHDLTVGQFLAYEAQGRLINVVGLDARIDLEEPRGNAPARRFLHEVLLHEPNFLLSYTHLAQQSYLVPPEVLQAFDALEFQAVRLGRLKADLTSAEPYLREADLLTVDLSVIRRQDAPGTTEPLPFGLSGEEACLIAWYAGRSSRLSSLGLYGMDPHTDQGGQTAFIVATMLWYFLEGVAQRERLQSTTPRRYTRYRVPIEGTPQEMVFLHDGQSEHWWLEIVPDDLPASFSGRRKVPCSAQDYERAMRGELPEAWLKALRRSRG